MKIVIFGLSISSSWGNGHATLWRGLCRALTQRGHCVEFFEKDAPYYAAHRDSLEIRGFTLQLYSQWNDIEEIARRSLKEGDVAIVTSFCPDALSATQLLIDSPIPARIFYDLDSPVTLERIHSSQPLDYLGREGLRDFDLVLSYAGGPALQKLQAALGARRVAPLYGSVDASVHHRVSPKPLFLSDLSYLGTFAEDRQQKLDTLFFTPASLLPGRKFLLAGPNHPHHSGWSNNIRHFEHLAPSAHAAFYCSSRMTLSISRAAMSKWGYCPSGRLFEASMCGVPILTDQWDGMNEFFTPGTEILPVQSTEDVIAALELSDRELCQIADAARERTLSQHTASHRAYELESLIYSLEPSSRAAAPAMNRDSSRDSSRHWGVIPAAGIGSRIQPLAFSKELLPVGSSTDEQGIERPRAVSEFIIDRMLLGGVSHFCFVISPSKSDIFEYFKDKIPNRHVSYTIQPEPLGLCDAIFRAAPLIQLHDHVVVGLPDTIWFPEDALRKLPLGVLAFLLFPSEEPQLFDAVSFDAQGDVLEIETKKEQPQSSWIWGAFQMPGTVYQELFALWTERERSDEYFGSLVNAYLRAGGRAVAVQAGQVYMDVGTLRGFQRAVSELSFKSTA